jgi:hypothetical protein
MDQEKLGAKSMENVMKDTPEKTEIENWSTKKCKRKYSRKKIEKKTVKKKLITVDSSGEDP